VKYGISRKNKMLALYLTDNNIKAVAFPCMLPPLRFWFGNRKGDSWARIVHEDGRVQYARYHSQFLNGISVDFFD
jgi:hypothetical protein